MIKHVDFDDEGDYTCEASNGVGIAQSYSIQLKVWGVQTFFMIMINGWMERRREEVIYSILTYITVSFFFPNSIMEIAMKYL